MENESKILAFMMYLSLLGTVGVGLLIAIEVDIKSIKQSLTTYLQPTYEMTTDIYYRNIGSHNIQNRDKELQFKNDELLVKRQFSLPRGDYRTQNIHVGSEEKIVIKSGVDDNSGPIKYYLFDDNGILIQFSAGIQFISQELEGSSCSKFTLLLGNSIDPINSKKVWLQISSQ